MKAGSLCSGLGMMDYGLEKAGFAPAFQVECDPFCNAVLEKHWPGVRRFTDVKTFPPSGEPIESFRCDLLHGGFPCQPHSTAGKRRGREDERNLWPDFARIVGILRPAWVLFENVSGLRVTMSDEILEDLEGLGYDVWPVVVGADDVGAPHRRKRVWIVGRMDDTPSPRLSRSTGCQPGGTIWDKAWRKEFAGRCSDFADTLIGSCGSWGEEQIGESQGRKVVGGAGDGELADTANGRCVGSNTHNGKHFAAGRPVRFDSEQFRQLGEGSCWPSRPSEPQHEWEAPRIIESSVGGPTDGRARRVAGFARKQALRALGNSVVWVIPYLIGRWIQEVQREDP